MAVGESNVIRMDKMKQLLDSGERLVLVDCRFQLGQPRSGREAYEQSHLPGALYMDLEEDLSGPVGEHGGRHPMPDLGAFVIKLSQLGMNERTMIVAYDDQGGAMASRLWWMLRFLGHSQVYVMDQGFSAWVKAGYPVTGEPTPPLAPTRFHSRVRNQLLVVDEDIRERLEQQSGTILIDSRERKRYLGEEEPIDKVAGHIPGAINRFWKDNLGADGAWLSPEELGERFADIPEDQEIIVYCGSGVTACPNILALAEAGRPDAKLYLGSWSDWISYEGNPIATGDEEKE